MPQEDELELLSIRQLKLVAEAQPQPYRIRVQVEANSERETAQGKPFREVKLVDGADTLTWRVFDGNPLFSNVATLKPGKWIELSAQWVDTGKFGLEPKNAALRYLEDEEVQGLLGGDELTRERQQTDFGDISTFITQIADPRLKGLCLLFLDQHGERFRRAAAARDYHHARRGGLVEHVAQMMRSAVKICEAYSSLNRDLLVAGVLFHDCGKLWENNYAEGSFTMPYSLHGEMVGHIALGMELVNKLWRQLMETEAAKGWALLEPSSELVRLHLLHLIGSHHGEMQFGSPVLPKTPEAIVLHHVDNIDAKLEMFRRGYDTSREIGTGIFERVRPLPANLVRPLDPVVVEPPVADHGDQATAS
jgi:3'-5' exoribonuclease